MNWDCGYSFTMFVCTCACDILFQSSIRTKEEENQRLQQKMRSLQDQVNLYRAMLPPDTTPTPALTLDTSSSYSATAAPDDLTPVQTDQTLTVPSTSRTGSTSSAFEVSLMSADVAVPTGSRPVSMVSATSETTSDDMSATADDERPAHDDDYDNMLQTLTSESLSQSPISPKVVFRSHILQ